MAEKLVAWLSGKRVSIALDLLTRHCEKVEDVVSELYKALLQVSKEEYEEALKSIERLNRYEEETDLIRRSLVEDLSKGELDAKDREDLSHMMRRSNIIADWAKDAAWNLGALIKLKVKIHPEICESLTEIGKLLCDQTRALRESIAALTKNDPDEASSKELTVEDLERKVDDRYHETKLMCFELMRDMDSPSFMFLRDLLKDLEQVSDFCEDAGDMIRSVAIRIKTPRS